MAAAWLSLPAFAKINLSLELLGARPDGYTEIRTLYQSVGLHDRVRVRWGRDHRSTVVRVVGGGAPAGRRNLAYRCVERARGELGLRRGVDLELEKNIPAGHGLGGGSSDAAAALMGLLRLARLRLPLPELMRLGAAVGADVPFFFLGGRVLGVGRGEEVFPLADTAPTWVVMIAPPLEISTRVAYSWAAERMRQRRGRLTPRERAGIIADWRLPPDALWAAGNDFEPILFPRFPELARIKAALLGAGAREAALSGSGSTVYALFSRRAAAEKAAAEWARAAAVFVVETLPRPAYQRACGLGAVVLS